MCDYSSGADWCLMTGAEFGQGLRFTEQGHE